MREVEMNKGTYTDKEADVMAALVEGAMYTDEERKEYARIIHEFNWLYYKLFNQTWCSTSWKGINVLKPPTDLWVYQEIISMQKPDLIIETGTMRGGSAVYMSDVLKLVNPRGHVISIDIDRTKINDEAFKSDVSFITGSSTEKSVYEVVRRHIDIYQCHKVMVILDSDHSYEHVTNELNIYSKLVTKGQALIVEDTNNWPPAKQAVDDWLVNHPEFTTDIGCEKYMLTFNRGGYLEKIGGENEV